MADISDEYLFEETGWTLSYVCFSLSKVQFRVQSCILLLGHILIQVKPILSQFAMSKNYFVDNINFFLILLLL